MSHEPDSTLSSPEANPQDVDPFAHGARFEAGIGPIGISWFATLAAFGVLLGRGLAPALPGTRSGIDVWITRIETGSAWIPALGAWVTQLILICGTWLCVHFLLGLLNELSVTAVLRAAAVLVGSLLLAVTALSNVAQQQLDEPWLLTLALTSALLAAVGAAYAMQKPLTRAAGIVLAMTTAVGVTQVLARWLALSASSQARASDFATARVWASVAFAAHVTTLLFALYWLLRQRSPKQLLLTLTGFSVAPLITWGAALGAHEGAPWWQVLAARTLNELRTHPDPLVLGTARDLAELSALIVGVLALTKTSSPAPVRSIVGLALISKGNIDIPLCALLLGCSALLSISYGIALLRESSQNARRAEREQPPNARLKNSS